MKMIHLWMGRSIEDLTREELIEAVEHLAADIQREREWAERERKMRDQFARIREIRAL